MDGENEQRIQVWKVEHLRLLVEVVMNEVDLEMLSLKTTWFALLLCYHCL